MTETRVMGGYVEANSKEEALELAWNGEVLLPEEVFFEIEEVTAEEDNDSCECEGCGCLPGDGRTKGCMHPEGCGFEF